MIVKLISYGIVRHHMPYHRIGFTSKLTQLICICITFMQIVLWLMLLFPHTCRNVHLILTSVNFNSFIIFLCQRVFVSLPVLCNDGLVSFIVNVLVYI